MFDPTARLGGWRLRLALAALEHPLTGPAAAARVRRDLGVAGLRDLSDESRRALPDLLPPVPAVRDRLERGDDAPPPPSHPWGASALTDGYRSGARNVEAVVARVLDAHEALEPQGSPFLHVDADDAMLQARASDKRWRAGTPLSPLDGVPVSVKEEISVRRWVSRTGTNWLPAQPASADAVVVQRLRAAGAIIVGQTVMTELGLSLLGASAQRRMPWNPRKPGHLCGGSSTGAAASVALGWVPLALAADAGGSVRVPAAMVGVLGLKPTYGRLPLTGSAYPAGGTAIHLGALGASAADLLEFFVVAAGPDGVDRLASEAPPISPARLRARVTRGVRGLRIGVEESEWVAAREDVDRVGRAALAALSDAGAELVPVQIALARHAPALGVATVGLEAAATLERLARRGADLGPDARMSLRTLSLFPPTDYVDAQRLRGGLRAEVAAALARVDVLALPSTAWAGTSATEAELRGGMVDAQALAALSRFAWLANLTGLPALSVPVGATGDGLPVGLQLIGDAWDEGVLFQVAAELERLDRGTPVG